MSLAGSVSFNNFCQLCTTIKNSPQEDKANILQTYIKNWIQQGNKQRSILDNSFFPVLRLLLPQLDRERGAYGVKEYTLARIYIRILSLPKDGNDAIKLLDYRAFTTGESGDFADIAYCILKNRCAEGGFLSVEDINNHLNVISDSHALNEPKKVESELITLLTSTSAEEQRWIIRILLKDVKLGIGQNGILKGYHPDAKDFYDANNNLRKVCDVLKNPNIRLNEIQIELFSPFKPMLSEECDIRKIDAHFKKAPYFYVETKVDGERFQLHMKDGNYKYFSRNGHDYTSCFGANLHEGNLTPHIVSRFSSDIKSCILDGEMISCNPTTKTFVSKGKYFIKIISAPKFIKLQIQIKGNHTDVKSLNEKSFCQPCFCAFDILLCNDEIITNKPLHCRLQLLNQVIQPLEGKLVLVNGKRVSCKEEVINCLNEAIDNREEGVVMKEFMSVYKPNIRKNGGWFKIKPEYTDGLSDTLDLLIIGGYFGSGRHSRIVSHFLLGARVSKTDQNKKLFYSTARVGSGYSMKELNELINKLQLYWNRTKFEEMPPNLEWTKEKPDVWIEPEKSFILEVKASEIYSSNLFKSGYTLRFPRVEKIRYDKSWEDCLTLEELEEKAKMASGKLAFFHFTQMETVSPPPKKRQMSSTLEIQNKAVNLQGILRVSNLLDGKEICVLTGFKDVNRESIEKKIVEFGGTVIKNPSKRVFCILAEDESTIKVQNVIKCGLHDIIYSSWFYYQLHENNSRLPDFKPENFLAISEKSMRDFSKSYDKYGDHNTLLCTIDSVKYPLAVAKKEPKDITLTLEEKFSIDVELFSGPSPYSLFRLCTAYFDRFAIISDPSSNVSTDLDIYRIDFEFRGGKCSDTINDKVTHIIVFTGNLARLEEINNLNRTREVKFHVFTERWITLCIDSNAVLSDCEF